MENHLMRVAVSQFATSSNYQENLATCVRMISKAAVCQPSIIVLPEFCNTLFHYAQPCYVDHNQAWDEALSIDGPFLKAIAEQAKMHNCYIVINVTLRRDRSQDLSDSKQDSSIKSNISVTSCLFSPLGELIHQEDKQELVGYENDFFISANKVSEVISTSFGKLGLLTGNDSMTFEASRSLALGGSQLLCNSINTFALDQSNLHDPARSFENKVFLVTANKVGALVAQEYTSSDKSKTHSSKNNIPQEVLIGTGNSQIVSPDGKVLAKIMGNEEGVIFADIDLASEDKAVGNKCRPDGTELFKQRRPELYQKLATSIEHEHEPSHKQISTHDNKVPETANVAIFATYKSNEEAIEDVCFYIENNLSDIIQLPELFFIADKTITNNTEELAHIAYLCELLIKQISEVLRPFQYVCTSLVIEGSHQAVIISEHGLFATQQQLHFCQRYQWTELGDDLNIIELPLEQGKIKVVMLTADDANIPEIVNIACSSNIHLLLIPFDIQESAEVEYSLLSRAVENRVCIVAACREKSFTKNLSIEESNNAVNNAIKNPKANKNKNKTVKSSGFIANLTECSFFTANDKSAKFNGYVNQPLVKHQHGKITKALVHPIAATKQ
jgi:predicted amidohydrolase